MIVLVNEPVDVISEVLKSVIVGLTAVLQQTPLSEISTPPSEIISPPPSAVEFDIPLICNVLTVGIEAITTFIVCIEPEPHELFAVTEIFPLFAPAVAVIEVESELPLHPDGKVHVYDVAPFTAVILYVWEAPWHTVSIPGYCTRLGWYCRNCYAQMYVEYLNRRNYLL